MYKNAVCRMSVGCFLYGRSVNISPLLSDSILSSSLEPAVSPRRSRVVFGMTMRPWLSMVTFMADVQAGEVAMVKAAMVKAAMVKAAMGKVAIGIRGCFGFQKYGFYDLMIIYIIVRSRTRSVYHTCQRLQTTYA